MCETFDQKSYKSQIYIPPLVLQRYLLSNTMSVLLTILVFKFFLQGYL